MSLSETSILRCRKLVLAYHGLAMTSTWNHFLTTSSQSASLTTIQKKTELIFLNICGPNFNCISRGIFVASGQQNHFTWFWGFKTMICGGLKQFFLYYSTTHLCEWLWSQGASHKIFTNTSLNILSFLACHSIWTGITESQAGCSRNKKA